MKAVAVIKGSFQVLRRRTRETGHPGMGIWSEAGEKALAELSHTTLAHAHANECDALDLAAETRAMLADGVIDAAERRRLARQPHRLQRIADRSHDTAEDFAP